ncbi:MAG TPA: amidohydrolase [Opitutaceae bacterium]|nr:amidohydrolase [Opitutaceae bacterium]
MSCASARAQATKEDVLTRMDETKATYADIAAKIWSYAEVGYQETKSSGLLQEQLKKEGFEVKNALADEPTSFIASYGSGHPIIAIIGEFDALPELSQEAWSPVKKPLPGAKAGHGCGHNLFGAGSASAAAAVKAWMIATGQKGTLRYYGCPAEEGGSGKVYMVRAGLFDDVDAVIHWHPSDQNSASPISNLANKSAKFRFHGSVSGEGNSQPRSAIKGMEAMDVMVAMMRDQMPSDTVVQYAIEHGGSAPNVPTMFAESFYYVRHHSRLSAEESFQIVLKAAQGAATGTGTKVDWEIIHGNHELLPNDTLNRVMYENMVKVGGYTYTAEEKAFAEKLGHSLPTARTGALELSEMIQPYQTNLPPGQFSTDVGDITWNVPTAMCFAAVVAPGVPLHSWQATACTGTSIGFKGMMVAAKTLALTAMDLFGQPDTLAKAKAELMQRRGPDFKYQPLVGNRKPPLDYRN